MPPSPIAAPSRTRVVRVIVQAVFVAIIAYLGVRHQLVGGRGGAAPLDSFCPFGAIEALPALLGGFGMLPKTGTSNFVLLGAVGIVTLGLSASFCGWLCPFGAVQDWLSLAGKRVFGRQLKVPEKVHAYLRHVRWAVLALIVYMSWTTLGLWFADYDPFRALFHFKFESWIAFLLVGLTLVLGLAIERFWCLYACPLGAVVGFFGRLGLTKVQRDSAICIDCGVCNRECPSRLDVATAGRVVDDHCTMCAECVDACPVPGALTITTGSEKESLRPVAIGLVSALLLLALIGTAQTLGWWQSGSGCGGCSEAPQAQSVASASTPADSPLE